MRPLRARSRPGPEWDVPGEDSGAHPTRFVRKKAIALATPPIETHMSGLEFTMSQQHFPILGVLGGLCLALGCATILGIEDAECDPSYDRDCLDEAISGSGGSTNPSLQTAIPPLFSANGGSAGSTGGALAAAGAAGAAGAGGNMSAGGSSGSSAGAAGSGMAPASATAGAAGMGSLVIDPIVARASALCLEYCDTLSASCTAMNQQYASRLACLAVCELLPPGTAGVVSGNTVQCRLARARSASSTGEANLYCASAGPGGADVCGSDCDGYCTAMTAKCSREIGNLNQCLAACSIVPDLSRPPTNQRYNVSMQSGDSVQCRLFHVTAATLEPAMHCGHASGLTPCSL
jgi:hypothetical protein